jgi:hypothetical protein
VDGLKRDELVLVLGDARDEVQTRVSTTSTRVSKASPVREMRAWVCPPLVDDLLLLELDEVALLVRAREHERRDVSDHARLLLERRVQVPLGQARLALATNEQDGLNLQASHTKVRALGPPRAAPASRTMATAELAKEPRCSLSH